MSDKNPTKADAEAASVTDELFHDRILDAMGDAVQEAVCDHKRAGNPIAEWRDGQVVIIAPDKIEA